jgi:Protein of unknown function (DUF1698)
MVDQGFDPCRFFDAFPRFVETSETGPWLERLNARYVALIHENRELIRGKRVLDLASHDGRFSFAALQNGASRVVGIEHKANLRDASYENMAHYEVPRDRYDFVLGDMFEHIDGVGPMDVVFCFGILYHINNHMLLLSKIAEVDPQYLIIDSRISQMEGSAIEVRSPLGASPPPLGSDIEGQPTRAALDAMLSYFGWTFEYFDWAGSTLTESKHLSDYRIGKRVSVVVQCFERATLGDVRDEAVRLVFERQQNRRTQWLTILEVAAQLELVPQALRVWVRRAEQRGSGTPHLTHGAR